MGFPASTRRSQGALRVSRQRLLGPANSISPKSTRSYGTPGPPRQDRTDLEPCATSLRLFRYAVSAFLRLATRPAVPLLSLQSIAITHSRVMAKDDPRLPLLEKQQQDLYRAAIQRSGRPWKAIAGKAVSRRKRAENASSSSSAAFMPTSEECTSTHSPSTSKVSGFEG